MPTLRFDGATLEEAVEAAKRQVGATPKIVAATRVRKGGVGGFFAREHIEVEVEVDSPAGPVTGAVAGPGATSKVPNAKLPLTQPVPSAKTSARPAPAPAFTGGAEPRRAAPAGRAEPQRAEAARGEARRAQTAGAETAGAAPRRAEPRRPEPRRVDDSRGMRDDDDPMSALIVEMADSGPSSVLDLAEKVNADQGHFALAGDVETQGAASRETLGREALARAGFPVDALAERDPISPVAPANAARFSGRREDRREDKNTRRRRQPQPVGEVPNEQAWDEPPQVEVAPSTGFAAVLERIAREAGLAVPDGRRAASPAPAPAPMPASHADAITTELAGPVDEAVPRGPSAPAEWAEPRCAPGEGAEPRWLASPAGLARLAQPAPPAPIAPEQQMSDLGLALRSLGVPLPACRAVTPATTRESLETVLRRALDLALPPLPVLPKSTSSVVAVVGPRGSVMSTARVIAQDLGASTSEIALATQRKVWRQQDRVILSPEVAVEERRSWRWRSGPSVVAIEQDVRPERSAWTTAMLQALEPTLCWGVAEASHKPEDLAAWSQALGGLDVLALVDLDGTTTPAAALATPIPVGLLDGKPATPAFWATLLCARLTE